MINEFKEVVLDFFENITIGTRKNKIFVTEQLFNGFNGNIMSTISCRLTLISHYIIYV